MADFETTTVAEDCRVWLWGLIDIADPENAPLEWGNSMDTFVEKLATQSGIVYFHNLGFDGRFIIDWLMRNGYEHVITVGNRKPDNMCFTTLISNMNKMYTIKVTWATGKTIEFRDSLKKINLSVERIAHAFKLDIFKGDIDYHLERSVDWEPTEDELDYLDRDIRIVAQALRMEFDAGMTKLTTASDSMAEYKNLNGHKWFAKTFPILDMSLDAEIRKAYRGGFTYLSERFKGCQGSGIVFDVNSLYPYIMYTRALPYGDPVYVEGKPEISEAFPCAVFSVTLTAKLKENHVPCIQIKGSSIFGGTEYIKNIDEPTTIMMTNVDFDLYKEHYDIEVLNYGGGWLFKAATGMFEKYIDKWMSVKANSEGGKREIAKLHLNSLWGKFAKNPNVTSKYPVMEDDRVKYVLGPEEFTNPVYTPLGVFVTSYAREVTIRSAQKNYDTFAYADTDSLHLLTDTVPVDIDVHPTRLGAWKHEYDFESSYFLRPKAYLERKKDGTYKTAFAGVPERVSSTLTFEDITEGRVLTGKLAPKAVPGGVVLQAVEFTIKL
jgi:hypothetical protein